MLAWRKKPERSITRLQAIRISLGKRQVPFADEMGYNPRKYYRFEQSPNEILVLAAINYENSIKNALHHKKIKACLNNPYAKRALLSQFFYPPPPSK